MILLFLMFLVAFRKRLYEANYINDVPINKIGNKVIKSEALMEKNKQMQK